MLRSLKSINLPVWLQYTIFIHFIVYTIFIAAIILHPNPANLHQNPGTEVVTESHALSNFTNAWNRYDTKWYTASARWGYEEVPQAIAFAPLFPFLIKLFSYLIGSNQISAALIISATAAYLCSFQLYKFFELIFENKEVAENALLYFLLFPLSFILFAGYTESLFLLFLILSWRSLYEENYLQMGLWGALATLTRFAGVLICIPFGLYLLSKHRDELKQFKLRNFLQSALALIPIPTSFFLWGLFSKSQYGLTPWEARDEYFFWSEFAIATPLKGVIVHFQYLLGIIPTHSNYSYYAVFLNLLVALIIIAVSIFGFKHLLIDQITFLWIFGLLAITALDTNYFLNSTARYAFTIIPLFIYLPKIIKPKPTLHKVWIASSALLLVISVVMFYFSVFIV